MKYDLDRCLKELDDRVDPARARGSQDLIRRTMRWEPVERLPAQITCPVPADPLYDVADWKRDIRGPVWEPELMMLWRLRGVREWALIGDDRPLVICTLPDCILIPTLFGAHLDVRQKSFWMNSVGDRAAVEKLIEQGVPDVRDGWGWKVIREAEFFLEALSGYPRLRECVKVGFADVQGPFDNACEVAGDDFFYWLYDAPELVTALVELMTKTQMAWYDAIMTRFAEAFRTGRAVCSLWGPPANVHLVVDSCECISPEMYTRFSNPFNERIYDRYGGGSMHFCGKNRAIQDALLDTRGLTVVDIGQYPRGTDDFRRRLAALRERKIGFLYVHDASTGPIIRPDDGQGVDTGMYQIYGVKTLDEAKRLVGSHPAGA